MAYVYALTSASYLTAARCLTLMLSAVGLVYGLAAFTPTRVLNGRSGTPLHTHTAFWGALAAAWMFTGVQRRAKTGAARATPCVFARRLVHFSSSLPRRCRSWSELTSTPTRRVRLVLRPLRRQRHLRRSLWHKWRAWWRTLIRMTHVYRTKRILYYGALPRSYRP